MALPGLDIQTGFRLQTSNVFGRGQHGAPAALLAQPQPCGGTGTPASAGRLPAIPDGGVPGADPLPWLGAGGRLELLWRCCVSVVVSLCLYCVLSLCIFLFCAGISECFAPVACCDNTYSPELFGISHMPHQVYRKLSINGQQLIFKKFH